MFCFLLNFGTIEKSDYNCSYNASEDDILPRIPQTKSFIDAVIGLIRK